MLAQDRVTVHAGRLLLLAGLAVTTLSSCKQPSRDERGKKVLHIAIRSKVGSLDPVMASNQYSNIAQSQIYETLLDFDYLARPYELRPLLLERMPEVSADQTIYRFTLRDGVVFHDDPCFVATEGKGRPVDAEDVLFSIKRMADRSLTPRGWWIYNDRIKGFDEFKATQDQRAAGAAFDHDAPVEGLVRTSSRTFEIHLKRPYPQLLYALAMTYTSIVPREATETYGPAFSSHPVGTGPFRLRHWLRGTELAYTKNESYRAAQYPAGSATLPDDLAHLAGPAGRSVPFIDGLIIHVFEQYQPMWLKFRVGDIDLVQAPPEYYPAILDEQGVLRPRFVEEGLGNFNLPLMDMIHRGFNMEDPIVGGFGRGSSCGKRSRWPSTVKSSTTHFSTGQISSTTDRSHRERRSSTLRGCLPTEARISKRRAPSSRAPDTQTATASLRSCTRRASQAAARRKPR